MAPRARLPEPAPERRIAELTAENEALRATLRAVPDLVFELDEHGRYHSVWAREPQLLVEQESKLLGRTVAEMLPAEAAAACMATIEEALRTGQSSGRTIRLAVAAGARSFELSAAAGRVVGSSRRVVLLSRDVTERLAAQEERERAVAAHEAAERFARAVFDASPSPTCVVDAQGAIVRVNRAWREFARSNDGAADPGPSYFAACEAVTGSDAPQAAAMAAGLRAVLAGQRESYAQEYPCNGPSEERRFQALVSGFGGDGPTYALVEHVNITERTRLARCLAHAQTQARLGNWELDLAMNHLWWSDELHRIFEVDPLRFGASYDAFLLAIHPDDRALVDSAYRDSLVTRLPYRITHRLQTADGRIKFIEERGETEYAPGGGPPLRSFGTAQDVTEQVRTELRLAEAQRVAGLGAWELDLATQRLWYSAEQYRLHGFEVGAPIEQQSFLDLIHPDDLGAFTGAYATALAEGSGSLEYRLVLGDGVVRHLHGTCTVTRDAAGRPVSMSGTNQDVTSRYLAEQRLTASLREKETLLREVHHRVKNNLQIVSSLLHFQAKKVKDPDALAVFDDVRTRLRSMTLVHERLYRAADLSRVDLGSYVKALTDELAWSCSSTGPTLSAHVDPGALLLPMDLVLPVGMLLTELITNALKHAFLGVAGGAVRVEVARTADTLVLVVQDDGVGLPSGLAFAEPTTFGLQLVQNLVQQLGATIELATGPGARFTIRVPLARHASSEDRL